MGLPPVFTLAFNVALDAASAQALTNYSLSTGTPLIGVALSPDGTTVCLTAASNLVEGADYRLMAENLKTGTQSVAMTNTAVWSFTYHALIMADDFSADSLGAYDIVDEGTVAGPSAWSEGAGRMLQGGDIHGPDSSALDHRQGTFRGVEGAGSIELDELRRLGRVQEQ